jgi:hypothetical protein
MVSSHLIEALLRLKRIGWLPFNSLLGLKTSGKGIARFSASIWLVAMIALLTTR